jgi:transposase
MQAIDKAERNAAIHARRLEGMSLGAIGHEFGLNKSTVSEIARRMERKARWLTLPAAARRSPA